MMENLQEDAGDGSMQCTEHPFKNNTPAGGICAFCLQEKLGKLVSSSFPIAVFPSSSSSSPSFRSEIGVTTTTTSATTTITAAVSSAPVTSNNQISTSKCQHQHYYSNRSRILYLIGQRKKKKKDLNIILDSENDRNKNVIFKRSKSTAAATHRRYMDAGDDAGLMSLNKRGFWSFIHLQKHSKTLRDNSSNSSCASAVNAQKTRHDREIILVEENETFDRKVSRSRSVGCGSRSFSGDFFERISTGFGDCTLRRVESQREGKSKVSGVSAVRSSGSQDCIKERVRCGGLFSGFMITSSYSSSSSSSYFVTPNPKEVAGKVTSAVTGAETDDIQLHSRSRSWGWALASPMRAFGKPSKREGANKNQNPNLAAIPSLLSVRS